jgi:glycosyltransferase involved in cell wall biosynthesis
MIGKGHNVRVLLLEAGHYNITQPYIYQGVEVFPPIGDISGFFTWADVVITHLGHTPWTSELAKTYRKNIFFISHNTHPYDIVIYSNTWKNHERDPKPPIKVIYNSNAMKERLKYENPSIVLHPSIDHRKWDFGGPTGEHITLINTNANKGGRLFMALARFMPERKFLAITGAYDPQLAEEAPNVTIRGNSPDMEWVYRNTRILLMPSAYESWGMCATEAMCNGIPVIYHPTFGLSENVGKYGISIPDQNPGYGKKAAGGEGEGLDAMANLPAWAAAIERLDNPKTYKKYVTLSRKRALEFDPQRELQELENFFYNEAGNY